MELSTRPLYTEPIKVIDPESYSIGVKEYVIQFSKEIPKQAKRDVFSKKTVSTVIEKAFDKDTSTLNVKLALPRQLLLRDLRYLLCSIANVHVEALSLSFIETGIEREIPTGSYEENATVGCVQYVVHIKSSTKPRSNGYELPILPIIDSYLYYCRDVPDTNGWTLYPFFTGIRFSMSAPGTRTVDTVRLFNMNHTSDTITKVYLHDDSLNDFNGEVSALIAHIKSLDPTLSPLSNLSKGRNSVSFSIRIPIDVTGSVFLSEIAILHNNVIVFSFENTNETITFKQIHDDCLKWMNDNARKWITELHLEEAVYDPSFTLDEYEIHELSNDIHVELETKHGIDNLNEIMTLPAYIPFYNTKRTLRILSIPEHCSGTIDMYHRVTNYAVSIEPNPTQMRNFYFITITIGESEQGIWIKIRESPTIFNTELLISMVLLKIEAKGVVTSKDILKRLANTNADVRLKQLKSVDPIAFGERFEPDNPSDIRLYSKKIQRNERRPSVITKAEYELLKKTHPDAVLDVENQYTHQRLYLACPFEGSQCIGYEPIGNQLCLIKCGKQQTNPSDYVTCERAYNGNNTMDLRRMYSSTAIISFSPYVDPGRRCSLPPELEDVFPGCHLLRCPENVPPIAYLHEKYSSRPFIIERHPDKYVVSTQYLGESVLGIVTDIGTLFVLFGETDLYTFDSNTSVEFLRQMIELSNRVEPDDEFREFIFTLWPSLRNVEGNLLHVLENEGFELLTRDDSREGERDIVAVAKDGLLYCTPLLYNSYGYVRTTSVFLRERVVVQRSSDIMSLFPRMSQLPVPDKLFISDSDSGTMLVGVEILGQPVLVTPEKLTTISIPSEHVDPIPFTMRLLGESIEPEAKPMDEINLLDGIFVVLTFVNMLALKHEPISEDSVRKAMGKQLGKKSSITYNERTPSWRKSTIDESILDVIRINDTDKAKLLYEYAKRNYDLVYDLVTESLYQANVY